MCDWRTKRERLREAQHQKRGNDQHQQDVLNHMRAEEVTASQRAKRRNQSKKKHNDRTNEIKRQASFLKSKKLTQDRDGAKKENKRIPPPGRREELICSNRTSGRM